MMFVFFSKQPDGEPEPEWTPAAEAPEDDDIFDHRLEQFVKLGFDYLTALALAWNRVSPSEVRTKWDGANRETVARYFLGED